ncbi:hypothetical protein RHOER0001_4674 [Rhodococcus erythropolis SK121]|nr:hypothetical protein RHOER0001_4674 [Rhodococcus erythropolis SK121]
MFGVESFRVTPTHVRAGARIVVSAQSWGRSSGSADAFRH